MKRPAPTFEISVHFWSDPKVIAAGFKAAVLWIRCGCESRKHLTDGVVLEGQIVPLAVDLGDWKKLAEKLVENDLWKRCKGGYRIPKSRWERWQLTNAQVEEIRALEREKKRRQRAKSPPSCPPGTQIAVPEGHGGGPLSTSTSTSQSASASAGSEPDQGGTPHTPARRRGRAARWHWLPAWSPGPDDNPRSVLARLGVDDPTLGQLVRAKITVEAIVETARDVAADETVVSPTRVLIDRLQREYQVSKPEGPLGGEVMSAVGRIAALRDARTSRGGRRP